MIPRVLAILGMLLLAGAAWATESADLPARYQAIIDRSPFGQVQGAGAGDVAPNWLATWVFTGLIQSNSGNGKVQAIISTKDNSHSYFRAEGESLDGTITVVKIDQSLKQPKLVLKNGLETGTLTFPERATVASATPPGAPPAPPGINIPPPPGTAAPAAAGGPTAIRRIPFRRSN